MSDIHEQFEEMLRHVWKMRARHFVDRGKTIVVYMDYTFYHEVLGSLKGEVDTVRFEFMHRGTVFGFKVHPVLNNNPQYRHNRWEAFYKADV